MKTIESTLIFLRRGDEILLAMKKRGLGANKWNGVGGKIDAGETIAQALVRETLEEIAVTPLQYEKIAHHLFHMDTDTDKPWDMVVHTYMCTDWDGEPTESEEMAPKWFNISDIPYANMWEDDQHWLPLALEGKYLETEFTFDCNDHMLSKNIAVAETL